MRPFYSFLFIDTKPFTEQEGERHYWEALTYSPHDFRGKITTPTCFAQVHLLVQRNAHQIKNTSWLHRLRIMACIITENTEQAIKIESSKGHFISCFPQNIYVYAASLTWSTWMNVVDWIIITSDAGPLGRAQQGCALARSSICTHMLIRGAQSAFDSVVAGDVVFPLVSFSPIPKSSASPLLKCQSWIRSLFSTLPPTSNLKVGEQKFLPCEISSE